MFAVHRANGQPIGRMNHGNRTAPGITAALIGRRRAAGVIVRATFGKVGARFDGMEMLTVGLMMSVRCHGRMIVILSGRLRMARSGAACESKRNGNC